jgi:hypothetical protein
VQSSLPTLRLVTSSPAKPRPNLLPTAYVEARTALAACTRVDECKSWADKALALESYAKQMKDQSLLNLATKIRDRAVRRGGELLAEVKRERGKRTDKPGAPGHTKFEAAIKDAGLSPHQAKTMIRVASVPHDKFEALVETDRPANVKQLAELGTRKTERVMPKPYGNEWIDWVTAVRHLSALPACSLDVLASRDPYQIDRLRKDCAEALVNLDLWRRTLENGHGRPKATGDPD